MLPLHISVPDGNLSWTWETNQSVARTHTFVCFFSGPWLPPSSLHVWDETAYLAQFTLCCMTLFFLCFILFADDMNNEQRIQIDRPVYTQAALDEAFKLQEPTSPSSAKRLKQCLRCSPANWPSKILAFFPFLSDLRGYRLVPLSPPTHKPASFGRTYPAPPNHTHRVSPMVILLSLWANSEAKLSTGRNLHLHDDKYQLVFHSPLRATCFSCSGYRLPALTAPRSFLAWSFFGPVLEYWVWSTHCLNWKRFFFFQKQIEGEPVGRPSSGNNSWHHAHPNG